MKKTIVQFLVGMYLVLISCSNSGAEKNSSKTNVAKTAAETPAEDPSEAPVQGDGIVGDWKLMLETYDDNENKKLDPEERGKAFSNQFFYRFKNDGSCLVNFKRTSQGAFKGHYVIKEGDPKKLEIYLDETEQKGKESEYSIISVDKDELVLLESYGNLTFWIFKRA